MNDSPARSSGQDTRPRQHVNVGVHIGHDAWRFDPELYPADDKSGIARVQIIDGLAVQATDPAIFRTLAGLFTAAADSLDAAADEVARVALAAAEDDAWLGSKPDPAEVGHA